MTIDEIRMLALNLSPEERELLGVERLQHLLHLRIKKELMRLGTRKSSLGQTPVAVDLFRLSTLRGQLTDFANVSRQI